MIIELCGLPGSGKSTLVADIYEKIGAKSRTSLLRFDGILWLKWKAIMFSGKDWVLTKKEKEIFRLSCEYTNRDSQFIYTLLKLYRATKRHKKKNFYLLDEGLVQHLSSVTYDANFVETELLKRVMNIMTSYERIMIVCDCPTDIVVERIRRRNFVKDRYNLEDMSKMKGLLQLKKENIDFLLKYYSGPIYHLDMTKSLPDNLNDFMQILRDENIIS